MEWNCQVAKHINIKWQLVFVEDTLNPTITHIIIEAISDNAMG